VFQTIYCVDHLSIAVAGCIDVYHLETGLLNLELRVDKHVLIHGNSFPSGNRGF
jgi:hypothetical protein